MPRATIVIHGCIQDYQDTGLLDDTGTGLPDDQMRSRILFDVIVGDQKHEACQVELTQPIGTDYASEPVECGQPDGYSGKTWNHNDFCD